MKHLKTFEDNAYDVKVGDYVICIEEYSRPGDMQLKIGERYKVVAVDKISYRIVDKNDNYDVFHKMRFVSEIEYNTKKYNL